MEFLEAPSLAAFAMLQDLLSATQKKAEED